MSCKNQKTLLLSRSCRWRINQIRTGNLCCLTWVPPKRRLWSGPSQLAPFIDWDDNWDIFPNTYSDSQYLQFSFSLLRWELKSLSTIIHFSGKAVFLVLFSISAQVWELITVSRLTALPELADQEGSEEGGETEAGSAARICKIAEPHCQGFVSVSVIPWLWRSLCVWLKSNGMLTRPWSCLSNIISLDKGWEGGESSVPLKATPPFIRKPGARDVDSRLLGANFSEKKEESFQWRILSPILLSSHTLTQIYNGTANDCWVIKLNVSVFDQLARVGLMKHFNLCLDCCVNEVRPKHH